MDISQVLLGLAFVGLIFLLLNSYCGCNTLEGIEDNNPIGGARCNKKTNGKCPGIDGMLCTELKDCPPGQEDCKCPTREEILKKVCPPPSCPPAPPPNPFGPAPPPPPAGGACTAPVPTVAGGNYTRQFGGTTATLTCDYGYTMSAYGAQIQCTNNFWSQAGTCTSSGVTPPSP